ncbi:MAG: methylated-DNA--[protein]-cysteine S-methyltransferase [Proteobacteria bacterium]|nr:MAG: methylated-DNA--[protein]-cysteine S-methyltransferase [Pseudomonadota bacterium]
MSKIYKKTYMSPIVPIYLYADDTHLLAVSFEANDSALQKKLKLGEAIDERSEIIERTIEQLSEYFLGQRKEFDLPLKLSGTPFQLRAWEALLKIPYGRSSSYSEQALSIEKDKAVRAIGAANGKNAHSILIPCHRVVGKNGSLTGYAGGKEVKAALLDLEQKFLNS